MNNPDFLPPSPSTLQLQHRRRSLPPAALAAPGPDAAQLQELLSIAARVPDHGKLVPWRFIVFQGEGQLKAGKIIADVHAANNPQANAERLQLEARRLAQAPLVIGVISRAESHVKIPIWEQQLSCGAVCMNLIIAANAMGLGATWITEWYAYDAQVKAGMGLLAHENIAGFVHFGTPTLALEDRVRPQLNDIVSYF